MNKHLAVALAAAAVSAIWGYFADLQNDQIGWFIGRLIAVTSIATAFSVLRTKQSSGNA